MKYPMYAIKDVKVGFMQPTIDTSDQSAIRNFAFAINRNDGIMNFSPKDFDLYKIGEFDGDKGKITPCTPELVITGTNVFGVDV